MLWFVLLAVLALIVCLGVLAMKRGSQGNRRIDTGLGEYRQGDNRNFPTGMGGS